MNRRKTLFRLLDMVQEHWSVMTISTIMRALNYSCGITLVTMTAWAAGEVLYNNGQLHIGSFLAKLIGIGVLKGIFRYLEHFTGHYVAFHLLAGIRNKLYWALVPLAPADLYDQRSGDVISRAVGDVDRIEVFYAHTIAPLMNAVLVPTLVLGILWAAHPLLSLILFVFLGLVGLVAPWIADRLAKNASDQLRKSVGIVSTHLTDSILGMREILAFGAGERRKAEIRALSKNLAKQQGKVAAAAGLQTAISDLAIGGGIVSVLAACIYLVNRGALEPTLLLPVIVLATMAFGPVMATSSVLHEFNQAMSSASRLFSLIDRSPNVQDIPQAKSTDSIVPEIHFKNVSFEYPSRPNSQSNKPRPNTPVLKNLNFDLQAGKTLALVGPSGEGKSTVANLLVRFWDVTKGHILIGKEDIRTLPLKTLRNHIAIVTQQAHIFNTTIKENIRLGREDASDQDIEQAAKFANLHDFIISLPQGYQTEVGELGVKLSGGQRQRLALARALLKKAPILILDEPTSNLDTETERDIQRTMQGLMRNKTSLIIAHRLSTVIHADEILVLKDGCIKERGNHAQLLELGQVYAQLFAGQQAENQAQ